MEITANHPAALHERKIVLLLCLLGAVHVFIFSAAFPFFNVVDEQVHFDLVVRYSQGRIPRSLTPPCQEALPYIALFGTVEYLWPPDTQPGKVIAPPPWTQPMSVVRDSLVAREAIWFKKVKNHEASQPPLYYAVAGLWWRFCKAIGLHDGMLLYSLRFLNMAFIIPIVWLGWLAARAVFPERSFVRIAVPALIALMPQSTFYAINNDILSPLAFGAVFILLVKFWGAARLSPGLATAIGLALAATFLTKISNLPLLAAAGCFLALKIFRLVRGGNMRSSLFPLALLSLCAGLPMAAWMFWCKINFGDFTGSALKIQFLGWTDKPVAAWLNHPLFTPAGFWYFLKGNLSSFWQGEILWQREPLAIPAVGLVYALLTIGLCAVAFAALWRRPPIFNSTQRAAMGLGFLCLAASLAFFALLSVKYDFHDCFYPSSARPFFVSGRLMLGLLIPFLTLYACGLNCLMQKLRSAAKLVVFGALLAFMLGSEIATDWHIFPNPYNWFHM